MTCDAAIRPFTDPNIEVRCERDHDADELAGQLGADLAHGGTLSDYAWRGSRTDVQWHDSDRRSYRGTFPGYCSRLIGCSLPAGHPRKCAP